MSVTYPRLTVALLDEQLRRSEITIVGENGHRDFLCPVCAGQVTAVTSATGGLNLSCSGCDASCIADGLAFKDPDMRTPGEPRAPRAGRRASEIQPRLVRWLEHPYVPLGKLTAIAGQMGQAKTLWTTDLVSRTTRGDGIDCGAGSAIVLNAEDDPEDTIRPRLEAAGADLDRVWIEPTLELDVGLLASICDELGDVKLVTVDPVQAFMPANVNSWKGQDVRRMLDPLRVFAAERQIAVVLVQHLNRRSDASDPLARIADSQGIPQLARSVLIWGPDPADPAGDTGAMKALTRAKGNLTRHAASATYTIVERSLASGIKAPALERGEDRSIGADEVIADHETRTAMEEATEWLRQILADGPVTAKEVTRKAREIGIAERTLKRAKRSAGVVSEATRNEQGFTGWTWSIGTKPDGTLGILGPLGPLGQGAKEANEANKANVNEQAELDRQAALVEGAE